MSADREQQQYFNQLFNTALREARSWGVLDQLGIRHAYATALMWWFYGATWNDRPDIISGYRSPAEQRQLLQRWNAGDHVGINAKPACQSWHTLGRALDVENNRREWLEVYGMLMEYLGARWGKSFGDVNHFDLPASNQEPPNICET